MTELPKVWSDFQQIDALGRPMTLRQYFEPAVVVEVGRQVLAGDDEGNTCVATIAEVRDDGVVTLTLDLSTFHAAPAERATR